MAASSFDDIEEQEESIFEELGRYDFQNEPPFRAIVRDKARQQLAVSIDSPFSKEANEDELRREKEERAAILRDETILIRKQLESVKRRLVELKNQENHQLIDDNNIDITNQANKTNDHHRKSIKINETKFNTAKQKAQLNCSSSSLNHGRFTSKFRSMKAPEPKFRPLTGRADCPNCVCDRRSSVCDKCIGVAIVAPKLNSINKSALMNNVTDSLTKRNSHNDYDDRPIKPAIENNNNFSNVAVVNDVIVPGKVYTISKSLNEKRSKLAQAISELELMMDKIKERGNKLDQERKVVKLYKDQWKYGPNIGGPMASSRERLGLNQQERRTYESRLDSNLARDTKSLFCFDHIESDLKLRQYQPNSNRTSSSNIKSNIKSTLNQKSRSKSLESLKESSYETNSNNKSSNHLTQKSSNFQSGKSSSEMNLIAADEPPPSEDEEVEEILEETIDERDEGRNNENQSSNSVNVASPVTSNNNNNNNGSEIDQKTQKATWIPVFGESEIKQVKLASKRKVQIISPDGGSNGSTLSPRIQTRKIQTNNSKRIGSNFRRQDLSLNNQRPEKNGSEYNILTGDGGSDARSRNNDAMREVNQKLRFAKNLLNQEQSDSRMKNQLIINRRMPNAMVKQSNSRQTKQAITAHNNMEQSKRSNTNERTLPKTILVSRSDNNVDSNRSEIQKLEQKVNEQQRLLDKLAQSRERQQLISPVTVTCSSPCCHCVSTVRSSAHNSTTSTTTKNTRPLINTLRERLNKTKLRLAKTLEEEREKHRQLEQQVNSSLRKQSDLESENKLLKQSLNKCLDTCLKDISNTFESLSDTLENDTFIHNNLRVDEDDNNIKHDFNLSNKAQLICNNRYLEQLKTHIETVERQRRGIFEELGKEKQKSNHLEMQLKQSQTELNKLVGAKQELETRQSSDEPMDSNQDQQSIKQKTIIIDECQPSTSKQALDENSNQTISQTETDIDNSYDSMDIYRHYIQSMSPDIEAIRRDRRQLANDFRDIKKLVTDFLK